MRFVPIKTPDQQAAAMVLKARALLVRQRTQAINGLRAHLAELGIIAAGGVAKVEALIAIIRDDDDARLPDPARFALSMLAEQIEALTSQIDELERAIVTDVKRDEDARRLTSILGVGPIIIATVKALVQDSGGCKSARHFAAWLGLKPMAHSSGGKERLGKISKMGNPEMRSLLVAGATSVLRIARSDTKASPWLKALLARRPFKVAAVALANKMARVIWALLNKGGINKKLELPMTIRPLADEGGYRHENLTGACRLRQGAEASDEHSGRFPDTSEAAAAIRIKRVKLTSPSCRGLH